MDNYTVIVQDSNTTTNVTVQDSSTTLEVTNTETRIESALQKIENNEVIRVSATAPTNPYINQLWLDISI